MEKEELTKTENQSMAKWYLVQVVSNYEMVVKEQLENRELEGGGEIEEIFIPMKKIVSKKTKKTRERPLFPGYIFVKVFMTDDSWFIIRNTQFVTGIVGSSGQRTKPTPIPEEEILRMINNKNEIIEPMKASFNIADIVTVSTGTWAGNDGMVINIDEEKGIATLEINFLGRPTQVPVAINDIKI